MIELNENFKRVGGDNMGAGHGAKVIEDIADTCRVGKVRRVLLDPSAPIRYRVSVCRHTRLSTTTVHSSMDSRRIDTVGGWTTRFGIISLYCQPRPSILHRLHTARSEMLGFTLDKSPRDIQFEPSMPGAVHGTHSLHRFLVS